MAQLKIFKASAGSGKTHTLTREYLRLALSDPRAFERIQAVTFTNKATEEMKSRILHELYHLAQAPDRSPFAHELSQTLRCTSQELSQRALRVLRSILLDYSAFRVSTIDSFFQEILRSFAQELGLQGGFRLDLEERRALQAAITEVLAQQDQSQADTQAWLRDLAQSHIEQGDKYDLYRYIEKLGGELSKESVKQMILHNKLPNRKTIGELRGYLLGLVDAFAEGVIERAQAVVRAFDEAGLPWEAVSRASAYQGGVLSSIVTKRSTYDIRQALLNDKPLYSATVRKLADTPEKIFTTKDTTNQTRVSSTRLGEYIADFCNFIDEYLITARTALVTIENLGSYGLISDIETALQAQQRNSSTLLLANSASLINRILSDENGGEFIYEKIGTRIDHQMIDEFQDTSEVQYRNFYPLLHNNLSNGHDNLVVGDVKQSIYRWRGSDSSLLGELIERDFADTVASDTLTENWRSAPAIVAYNNALYASAPHKLQELFDALIAYHATLSKRELSRLYSYTKRFGQYYADAHQEVPESRRGHKGQVVYHYHEGKLDDLILEETPDVEDLTAHIAYQLPRTLIDLQKRGYKPSDIAILVRSGKDARAIADILSLASADSTLTEDGVYSLEIISAEALEVGRSPAVNFVIAALGYMSNPSSAVARLELRELWQILAPDGSAPFGDEQLALLNDIGKRSLYETVEAIVEQYEELFAHGQQPYMVKLLDMVLGYQQDLSVDIIDFLTMWHETGHSRTINTSEDDKKIHLMTIHKAKGLGFPVVLLPNPTWALERDNRQATQFLWCSNPFDQHQEVDLLPIKYTKLLLQTAYIADYIQERINLALDALNMLYVATTRAKQELHLWLPSELADSGMTESTSKAKKPADSATQEPVIPAKITGLIYEIGCSNPELMAQLDPSEYSVPNAPQCQQGHTQTSERFTIERLRSYGARKRIEVLHKGLEHFTETSQRTTGSLMHELLDKVRTLRDLEPAVTLMIQSGDISPGQGPDIRTLLEQRLSHPEVRRWFDGSGEVLRERDIIDGETGDLFRPDRVVLYPDGSAEVIDYKFGLQHKRYHQQVQRYKTLLDRMGYTPVRGYLWYLSLGILEQV